MELRDLEYFSVVAEHGNLGRAAEVLGLSQPALSKCLRRLEKTLQTKLVARTPKGVELTAEGNALLSHVRPLRLSLQDVARKITDLSQGRAGHIRLGSFAGTADYLLPTACGAFAKDAPDVTVTITVGNNPALMSGLINGELDVIIMSMSAPANDSMVAEHLFDEELVVYGSADHRLAKRKNVKLADLAQERWAFPSLDALPVQWVHHVFANSGLAPPRPALLCPLMSVRLPAIAESDLLGFSPKRSLLKAARTLRLREIPVTDLTWIRGVGIGYRKNAYLPPAAKRFIEVLKSSANQVDRPS